MQPGWERLAVSPAALSLSALPIPFHPRFHLPGAIGAVPLSALSLPAEREKGWGEKTELITVPSSPPFSSILDGTRGGTAERSVPGQAHGERGCFQPALRTRADRYLPTGKGESRWRKKRLGFQHNKRVSELMETKGDKTLNLHDSVP